jgi:hypothetical protein
MTNSRQTENKPYICHTRNRTINLNLTKHDEDKRKTDDCRFGIHPVGYSSSGKVIVTGR